ncbi:MAG: class I SAM-dependent methyltransferase [Acidobacteria bacterium]|nr:class I SAM-dependent methyltransferase [Acidobacteriota bacterium]
MARRITIDPRTVQEARFAGRRILEPEVMDGSGEVAAYLDGVATAHLDRMDDGFVRAAVRFARPGARILDIGTGTAAIPVKIALRRPDVTVTGIDLSEEMLRAARERIRGARLGRRVRVRTGSARRIPFRRGAYDLVVSNSLLHHLPDPVPLFDEIARVLAPGGRVFMRDLRRPGPSRIEAHIRRHGRFYRGEMLRLFSDSVRAAFKVAEMAEMVGESRLAGCRVRPQLETYVVIEGRPRRAR